MHFVHAIKSSFQTQLFTANTQILKASFDSSDRYQFEKYIQILSNFMHDSSNKCRNQIVE